MKISDFELLSPQALQDAKQNGTLMLERRALCKLSEEKLIRIISKAIAGDAQQMTEFRPYQYQVIRAVLQGKDVLAIMPTASGKSLCFQFPALISPGVTIVVEPIVALMNDQEQRAFEKLGIQAEYIKGMNFDEAYIAGLSNKKLIFLSPETLLSPKFARLVRDYWDVQMLVADEAHCISLWGNEFRPDFLEISRFFDRIGKKPQILALTATATPLISEQIETVLRMNPKKLYVLHKELNEEDRRTLFERTNINMEIVRVAPQNFEKIIACLNTDLLAPEKSNFKLPHYRFVFSEAFRALFPEQYLPEPVPDVSYCGKKEFDLVIRRWKNMRSRFDQICKKKRSFQKYYASLRQDAMRLYYYLQSPSIEKERDKDKYEILVNDILSADLLKDGNGEEYEKKTAVIVYCSLTETVDRIRKMLSEDVRLQEQGIRICQYHAKMTSREKKEQQRLFSEEPEYRVMIATNAYGMGIDKDDVRLVIHYEVPRNLENYYQEIGRSGRGSAGNVPDPARSVLYYYLPDAADMRRTIGRLHMDPDEEQFQQQLSAERFEEMVLFSENAAASPESLRGQITDYFLGHPQHESRLTADDMAAEQERLKHLTDFPNKLYLNVCHPAYQICNGNYQAGTVCECVGGVSFLIRGETIDYFDMMIANAVYTLGSDGLRVISTKKIFKLLTGDSKSTAEPDVRQYIMDRIMAMMNTEISITDSALGYFRTGAFLPLRHTPGKGNRKLIFRYTETPPLYEYAERHGSEFFSIDQKWLMITGHDQKTGKTKKLVQDSLKNIKLKTFLAWRVHLLPSYRSDHKKSAKTFNHIRFHHNDKRRKGMYEILGLDGHDARKCRRIQHTVETILDYYQKCGIIENYQFDMIKKGKTQTAVGVQLDKIAKPFSAMPKKLLFSKSQLTYLLISGRYNLNEPVEYSGASWTIRGENKPDYLDLMITGAVYTLGSQGIELITAKRITALLMGNKDMAVPKQIYDAVNQRLEKLMVTYLQRGKDGNVFPFLQLTRGKEHQYLYHGVPPLYFHTHASDLLEIPVKRLFVKGASGSKLVSNTVENMEIKHFIAWQIAVMDAEQCEMATVCYHQTPGEHGTPPLMQVLGSAHSSEKHISRLLPSIFRHLMREKAISKYQFLKENEIPTAFILFAMPK